ncbi:histone deacetylase [Ophidiomyces ophidiicola]|nr:histone deacetylase [Ophidiomyces ophidiicola]
MDQRRLSSVSLRDAARSSSSGRYKPLTTSNGHEQLVKLSQTPHSPLPHSSARTLSHSYRPRDQTPHHDPTAYRSPIPRRTTSIASLKDDRRLSTPSLQKRLSITSLRSVRNCSSPCPGASRRSSINMAAIPRSPSAMSESISPSPPHTALSIAADHFAREFALHQSTNLHSQTVVFLHDSCFGHRYARPRTSKAGLESIVERPERLHAGILGVAAAYVRMGKRWGDNPFAPHPDSDVHSIPTPPFQIRKTTRSVSLNSAAATYIHGTKWMGELTAMCEAAESRLAMNGKELVRPSSSASNASSSTPKLHEGDLYLCPESQAAFEGALGGVCEAIDAVFAPDSTRRAFVCIRPPGHHCSSNYPSGFCWINNVHIGIIHAAMTHGLTHAAIIDFDLHHGDGSQTITWEQNERAASASKNAASFKKTKIGYFSLHDINSYPCEDGDPVKVINASACIDNAHGQSIWNVHLEPWQDMDEFWKLYNTKYIILLEKARRFLRSHSEYLSSLSPFIQPKTAIFISAGFDASEWEGAGMQRHKVNVPTDFYARFTADIVKLAEEEGLNVDGRIVSVLEGGYSDRALTSGIFSHISALSDTRGSERKDSPSGLAAGLSRLMLSDENADTVSEKAGNATRFDAAWWSVPFLEELEAISQRPPPPPIRKPREKGQPSFLAHTQASAAKALTPIRDRVSSLPHHLFLDDPSVPEVDWALAAVELWKAMIPTDRQTFSFKHTELKVENPRTKRERHSTTGSDLESVSERSHMQLRERKPKIAALQEEARNTRPTSRTTRRTTIASSKDLPDCPDSKTSIHIPEAVNPLERVPSLALSVVSAVTSTTKSTPPRKAREPSVRPASKALAQTSRPGTSSGLTVQKPRAISSTRVTSSGRSSDQIPSPPALDNSTLISPMATSNTATLPDDIEKILRGVKKINLKAPSPEVHAALEAARLTKERKKVITKPQKKPAAKTARQPAPRPTSRVPLPPTSLQPPELTLKSDIPDACIVPLHAESNSTSPAKSSITDVHSTAKNLEHHQLVEQETYFSPPLTPTSPIAHRQITTQSAPPTAYTRENLPAFTSTSAIPFAPSAKDQDKSVS